MTQKNYINSNLVSTNEVLLEYGLIHSFKCHPVVLSCAGRLEPYLLSGPCMRMFADFWARKVLEVFL